MSFSVGNKERDTTAEPNVVPLCDVLLVLLIIFMVVTPLVQRGVDVQLPNAMNTVDMPENPEIVLYIREDGKMFLNENETTEDNLQLLLEDALMTASDKKLYLKADQEMAYGTLVDVINVIKEAGIELIGIIAEKKTEEIR